jgi:AbrB family looped-hinge helix DNA binding protein
VGGVTDQFIDQFIDLIFNALRDTNQYYTRKANEFLNKMNTKGYVIVSNYLSRTRIGRDLRTTVPREVRKILDIKEGDIVEWVFEDGRIIVRRGGGNG